MHNGCSGTFNYFAEAFLIGKKFLMPKQFKDENALVSFVIQQKLPDWKVNLYKRNAEAVQVHSQGQIFYKIDRLFPNEQVESKKHRVLAFESVTEGSFGKAANNINRIFKNSSYSFDASEKTISRANEHNFGDQNFFGWFLDEWIKCSLKEDPNALVVVYPDEYVKEGHDKVVFVSSCHIKSEETDIVIFISEKESKVEYELEEVKVRMESFDDQTIDSINFRRISENTFTPVIKTKIIFPVYHVFIPGDSFYRIEQLKGGGYKIDIYPLGNFMPVASVSGVRNRFGINKSFLSPFVPFGNLALLQHSQHTAVNFTFSFPRMSEIRPPCEDPSCNEGRVECEPSEEFPEGWKPCKKCNGTGYAPQSPYKVYIKRYDPQGMEGDNKYLEVPDVQYYTPPVDVLNYSKAEWKEYLQMAEAAVYVSQKVMTGHVESAKSKEIDRDDLYAFLSRVAQGYFRDLRFCLQMFENYLVKNPAQVTVQIPYSFAMLSETEAMLILKDIVTSNVPVMMKANQIEGFINKFVSQSSSIRKFIDVLKIADPLLFYSTDEVTSFRINNAVSAQQYSNHIFAFPTLQRMYFENNLLFLQDTQKIIDLLKIELAKIVPPSSELKTAILNNPSITESVNVK